MKTLLSFLLFLVLTTGYSRASSSHYDGEGLTLDLVSEMESIAAGEPFTVGVKIALDEGFHTYWQNPGIVGIPFALDWTLPAGFEVGAIQWPTPERIKMAIHPAHGFKRDITLLVEITPLKELSAGSVEMVCQARWMCCSKTCHPGEANLILTLPVAKKAESNAANEAVFASARADIPTEEKSWKAQGTFIPEIKTVVLALTGEDLPESLADYYFFSANGLVSSDQPQILNRTESGQLFITMTLSEYAPDGLTQLNGVLTIQGEKWPDARNVWISSPLQIQSLNKE